MQGYLELTATSVPDLSAEEFNKQAMHAKENCVISKALAGIQIELSVHYK